MLSLILRQSIAVFLPELRAAYVTSRPGVPVRSRSLKSDHLRSLDSPRKGTNTPQ